MNPDSIEQGAQGELLALFDYGRGKYHVPAHGPSGKEGWTQCGMRLQGHLGIKFEDEVAPEDICKSCLRVLVSPLPGEVEDA